MKRWIVGLVAVAVLLGVRQNVSHAVEIELVTVGNPGNPDGISSVGGVPYVYKIGKYEVTAGQYTEFLNAVAADDPHGLYNSSMSIAEPGYGCKIERTGSSGSYSYSVAADWADRPVNFVSFWDAARFANWLHNGQGGGDTESGAYINIGNQWTFSRQPGAMYVIPTAHEWYKAAYHKNNGPTRDYFAFATSSDEIPSNILTDPDVGNSATFWANGPTWTIGAPYFRTKVGAHENSESPYGTFDQTGNLWEWNETAVGEGRNYGGGSFYNLYSEFVGWSMFVGRYPDDEQFHFGFRVARPPIPPVANDDSYTTDEDTTLTVGAPGVLANDTDVNGSPLTAALVMDVANGLLSLNSDGSFTYEPAPDFFGADSFAYVANDGAADSNVATVTITVNSVEPVVDLDIAGFRATKRVSLKKANPISITLVVKNVGSVDEPRMAMVDGVQNGAPVYAEMLTVSDAAGGGRTKWVFPSYTPLATGDIDWTVVIDDDDADIDVATATSKVVN